MQVGQSTPSSEALEAPPRPASKPWQWLWPIAALGLLALTFRDVQWNELSPLLTSVGALALLTSIPPGIALLTETIAWRSVFHALGQRVAIAPLFGVRVATEAAALSLPGGVVWCEALKPWLLRRACGVGLEPALGGMAGRKYLLLISQIIWLLVVFAMSFGSLRRASAESPWLAWGPLAAAAVLGLLALATAALLGESRLAEQLHQALARVPLPAVRRRLLDAEHGFRAADRELSHFFALPRARLVHATLVFVAGWALESFDTWLILKLLGAGLDFPEVAACEALVVLLRHFLFFLPAGLGAQELGYVSFFAALGVHDATVVGAAFAALKRVKELAWVLGGYALLALLRVAPEAPLVPALAPENEPA